MRKNSIYGSILALAGLVILVAFLLDLAGAGYPLSILGALLGLLIIGIGAWTVTRKEEVLVSNGRRHERPRSDKPVTGN